MNQLLKKSLKPAFLLCILAYTLFGLAAPKDTIHFGYDPNWRPFQFIDDNGQHKGVIEDLLKLVEARSNFVFKHQPDLSWKKSLDQLKENKIDLLPIIEPTEARSKWMHFTDFKAKYPIVFIKKKGKNIFNIDTNSKYKVALPADFGLSEMIVERYPNLKVIETNGFEESLLFVLDEKADITFEILPVAGYYIERRGFNNLKIGGELDSAEAVLRMGVVKENKQLAQQLDSILITIPKEELAHLFDKWVSVKFDHGVDMKKVWRITFISSAIIILILSIILFWNRKLKKEIKRRIKIQQQLKLSNEEIAKQKEVIELKNEELSDSIRYAKGIQSAILPSIETFKKSIGDLFLIYQPKDIVSGDFYWHFPTPEGVYFAVADCTGHGVPGSLLSIVCNDALNHSIQIDHKKRPAEILNRTRELVVKEFEGNDREVYDGMDIALCYLSGNKLEYAGAHQALFIIRNGELLVTKADPMPIGNSDLSIPFTNHEVELQDFDCLYLFSDGFADQFGGTAGKKMKIGVFKKKLLEYHSLSIKEQEKQLFNYFMQFKEGYEQVDDVTLLGFRFKS